MRPVGRLLPLFLLILISAGPALAHSSFFTSRCLACHQDDTPTCNGCHHHHGNLSATTDKTSYLPGEAVQVTLHGGTQHGWIRARLYDENGLLVDLATGPTGTGDDGGPDPVVFPVDLAGTAPSEPGEYTFEAAWFGSNNNATGFLEISTPVSIVVESDGTGLPGSEFMSLSWKSIKALYE